ncbi:hypothetical protein ELH02_20750 [Rhizobium ruizarguesonis]|nr:hypothetical protein ELH18_20610 [Rhizobium ruizarguesonis]TBD44581.1 hypothetical protein ELH19_21200 [Rhizobium ruizarguesonis]TBD60798.1 hypothetical protein ELH15_20640 [Rhizobium ruizarguesonis]TBD87113.1 hypothetical protein ELH13_20890 [Rhizobium ruizarguesonis]TBD91954.1 hypothetical protein ELH14_20995 [Rhizobium ruizarguesonis]
MRPVSNRAARPIRRSIALKVADNPFRKSFPIFEVMLYLLVFAQFRTQNRGALLPELLQAFTSRQHQTLFMTGDIV